jgi:D-sedoheptulose 7-phosphate isomerase
MAEAIEAAIGSIRASLDGGGALLTCGNGGSAAEALHLSEELTGKYRLARAPRRAICLCADPTALTCIANDFGYDAVFARQVEALARPGDCLAALTTSGNSPNVLAALEVARGMGVTTIGLLGRGGGRAAGLCDHTLVVASEDTAHIQEAHQVIVHLVLEAFEPEA